MPPTPEPAIPVPSPLAPLHHPAITVDLRYATADNLTGVPIYDHAQALLHTDAANALLKVADLAQAQGLHLRVFDAYRPQAAQWRLWRALPDPRFVADPRQGSMHSRGIAVDLTLTTPAGEPLDMGTGFDDMTPGSFHGCTTVSADAQHHRALLAGLMALGGFVHHPCEWWHYNLPDAHDYPLLPDEGAGRALMAAQAAGS